MSGMAAALAAACLLHMTLDPPSRPQAPQPAPYATAGPLLRAVTISSIAADAVQAPAAPGQELDAIFHPGADITPQEAAAADAARYQQRIDALGGSLSEFEMRRVLEAAGWPEASIPQAIAVAYCESRFSPYAVGDAGASLGLFQLWNGWFDAFHVDRERWHDAVTNAAVALRVLQTRGRWGGPGGWSCADIYGIR